MREEWEDGTWSAWDGQRTAWFSCWSVRDGDTPVPAADLLESFAGRTGLDGEEVELSAGGTLLGRGVIGPHEEDGKPLWNLKALSATDGRIALLNLYYHDEADREWALSQWRALTCEDE